MADLERPRTLSWVVWLGYGVGHVLNDVCASMWFTYLLVYFHLVLGFTPAQAGVVLLVGQIADAIATPFVGFHSDRADDFWFCRYGRRKTWHLLGTICTIASFPFIFSPCIGCTGSHAWAQLFYYCAFVCIFQFGWAAVQISHLSLIPELTADDHGRTKLTAVRYSFTVFSSILVYTVTWLMLRTPGPSPEEDSHNLGSSFSNSTMPLYLLLNNKILYEDKVESDQVGPNDAFKFQEVVFIGLAVGGFASFIFHLCVRESPPSIENSLHRIEGKSRNPKQLFKDIRLYQVAGMYMCTRLFVNLSQVFIPLYLHETLVMAAQGLAIIPLVMFLSSLVTSPLIQPINKLLGRKFALALGAALGISACVWARLDLSELYKTYFIYGVAFLFGSGGSIMLVTSLGVTADFIGQDTDCSAFVYGLMSFTDKLSNGLAVIIIQNMQKVFAGSDFYRDVLTYVCAVSALLAVLFLFSLSNKNREVTYQNLEEEPSAGIYDRRISTSINSHEELVY